VIKNYLPIVNFLLLLAIAAYILVQRTPEKKAYVLNQRVFDEFKGKKELELKLKQVQDSHKGSLDSMVSLIQQQPGNKGLIEQYQGTLKSFELEQQQLSDRYTADIWKRINQYISEYGKEKGYDFIFGATGNGGLMYANDANNITEEIIPYINNKYETGN